MEPIDQNKTADADSVTALGRDIGQRSVERLSAGLARLVEETSALYRWALTMLVLLNAGGLYLGISARGAVEPDVLLVFFGGMMMALLAALVGLALTVPVAGAMRRALTDWTDVALSGALTDEAMASARRVRRMGTVWLAAMSIVALLSLALFASGTLMLGERFGIFGPPTQEAVSEEAEAAAPGNGASLIGSPANASSAPPASVPSASAEPAAPTASSSRAGSAKPAGRPAPATSRSPSVSPQMSTPTRSQRAADRPSAATARQASPSSMSASPTPAAVPGEAPLLSVPAPESGN